MNPYVIPVIIAYALWCAGSGWTVGKLPRWWKCLIVPLVILNGYIGYNLPVWLK